MREKIRNFIDKTSEVLEIVINVILIIAVIIAIISLWDPLLEFINNRDSVHAFLHFLEYVLNILIGIEFFKMLCNPDMDTVRHMVVIDTSAMENLLTIIGIAIVFVIKKYLRPAEKNKKLSKKKKKDKEIIEEKLPE